MTQLSVLLVKRKAASSAQGQGSREPRTRCGLKLDGMCSPLWQRFELLGASGVLFLGMACQGLRISGTSHSHCHVAPHCERADRLSSHHLSAQERWPSPASVHLPLNTTAFGVEDPHAPPSYSPTCPCPGRFGHGQERRGLEPAYSCMSRARSHRVHRLP
jgi:hypothetical protein